MYAAVCCFSLKEIFVDLGPFALIYWIHALEITVDDLLFDSDEI